MAAITPVLWKHKKNREGQSPIYLRINAEGRTRYVSLREKVRASQWNERKGRVRSSHPHADELNALIAGRVAELEKEAMRQKAEGESVSAAALKAAVAPEPVSDPASDFFAFGDSVVDGMERQGKLYTARRYKSILRKARAYTGEPLPFDAVTPTLLREYETHLVEHYQNAPNTVASNFRAIRAILYRAIREGHASQAVNPFFSFKIKRQPTNRTKLTVEQLQAIEALDLDEGSLIWHVRNYFLFSLYCGGVRFGDVAKMKRRAISDGRLTYTMSKTGSRKAFRLLPQAWAILAHYGVTPEGSGDPESRVFPLLNGYDISTPKKTLSAISAQNALTNKYLKKLAERAGLSCDLSFHVSRHSFADIARKRGLDVYVISKALGHSSLKVTERYLRGFDEGAVDEAVASVFS